MACVYAEAAVITRWVSSAGQRGGCRKQFCKCGAHAIGVRIGRQAPLIYAAGQRGDHG